MTVRVRVIPCLDVADGRVVKGVNFVELRDAGDPVEQARAYDAAGADELCFLDISASHEGRGTLLDIVRRTAEVCFMPLTVGGGVRTAEDARALLLAGALGYELALAQGWTEFGDDGFIHWPPTLAMILAAVATGGRALRLPGERLAWGAVCAGLVSYTAGTLTWQLHLAGHAYPSIADPGGGRLPKPRAHP